MLILMYSIGKDLAIWTAGKLVGMGAYMIFGHIKTPDELLRDEIRSLKNTEVLLLQEIQTIRRQVCSSKRITNKSINNKHINELNNSRSELEYDFHNNNVIHEAELLEDDGSYVILKSVNINN
jgi:hypothetical protein